MSSEAEEQLVAYLETTQPKDWQRVTCCESSRSLYCSECCKLLIPDEDWPPAIRSASLKLPFDMDIIMDCKERRTSSTGVQMATIANSLTSGSAIPTETEVTEHSTKKVVLYDLERVEMPAYDASSPGVYVLFPDDSSVPISTVASDIEKLVVLDIKWTRQLIKSDPVIANLPKVHLDSPPAQSHFWRWHNSGAGMLSTIEAIYFAAMEATEGVWDAEDREKLVQMMWLFALQHSVIHARSEVEQRLLPFTEEGKQAQRSLRTRQTGNPKKKKGAPATFYKDLP